MKTIKNFALWLLALAMLLPLAPLGALAQTNANNNWGPRIEGFDVQQVSQATPGQELMFTLYGTAGGQVSLQIAGSANLNLSETEPGVYEGSYTIRQRDRLTPATTVTANLRQGNRVATALLDESLLSGYPSPARPAAANASARIDQFDVRPANNLSAGASLGFVLRGTPGSSVSIRIAGIPGNTVLSEVRPGEYEGAYTVKYRDQISSSAAVTATLRQGTQSVTRALGQNLSASGQTQQNNNRQVACATCGAIEAINPIEVRGEGGYVGKIAGGVVGALLGSQVGGGRGKTAAEIAGALGGVCVGNEIEKRNTVNTHWEVVVRLDNGTSQTISYATDPQMRVGSRVRVEQGVISAI